MRGIIARMWNLNLRILTAVVLLLVATVAAVTGYTYVTNTAALLEQSEAFFNNVEGAVMEKVTNHLSPAVRMVGMSSRLVDRGTLSLRRPEELEHFSVEVIRTYPQLAMFNIGDEQGNFLMPKKYPDGRIDTKIIRRTDTPPTVTWKIRDRSGKVVEEKTSADVQYDPRGRPWYVGAKEADGMFWTDMYIFFTDKKPGVTASYPVKDPQGKLIGVFGLDIELGELSDFLGRLDVGRHGAAFIVNGKNEVVAHPDPAQTVRSGPPGPDGTDSLRPARVDELEAGWVTAAFREREKQGNRRFSYETDQGRYLASFAPLPAGIGKDWTLVVAAPEDDFIGFFKESVRTALLISLGILVVGVVVAVMLSRSISRPITVLAGQTAQIRDFDLDKPVGVESRIWETRLMSDALSSMRTGLIAFRKYVPAALVRELIQTGEETRLGGQTRELTIFFSDVKDFTTISEGMTPEQLFPQLSEYLDAMTGVVMKNHGTVDKYIGDCVMAFWGAPAANPNHARDACRTAVECQRKLDELNGRWKQEGKPVFETRIGVHTGPTMVGNVGSTERMNYTVMGDTANLASRLEGVNKLYGSRIIVSETTRAQAGDEFLCRPLDKVKVKGKEQAIQIHELMVGDNAETKAFCDAFAAGFKAYLARDWEKAEGIFKQLPPDDEAVRLYLRRCAEYRADPPGADWDGTSRLTSK